MDQFSFVRMSVIQSFLCRALADILMVTAPYLVPAEKAPVRRRTHGRIPYGARYGTAGTALLAAVVTSRYILM